MDESKYIHHEGKWYARVSSIISSYGDEKFVKALENPQTKEEKRFHKNIKDKAPIGSRVHQAIDIFLRDGFAAPGKDGYGYFCSFLKWFEVMNPTIVLLEERYFDDKLMITGQIDGIYRIKGDPFPIIVDYKTSAKESPTWIMQGHLYNYLCTSQGLQLGDRALFLKLDRESRKPHVFEYKITQNMMNICFDAVEKFHSNQQTC